ncbi:hypothetical protein EHV15_04015 [Paenibacillus oralis]|uniref:Protein kinase domain-containing protein n=1 Tax=Paenibacillus oralis TaxID=2490856 RepID=A0A3P3TWX7_9BACL|nr:hypothetical protein [Paenibacillus oralis]RRJ62206.1 hypothetical protein EHV15_04015 [Paenibacillus oralis]
MGTIYAKYSRERLPKYQIKTNIIKDKNIYVSKTALTNSSKSHIKQIYDNYRVLDKIYLENSLVKPIAFEEDTIVFEYLQGKNLDQVLINSIINKSREQVFEILDLYSNFVSSVGDRNYCEFYETSEFVVAFGKHERLVGLKSFTVSNIDLNFDNILLDDNKRLCIIDYEWVYEFPIPLNFIKFRAINSFYYSHYNLVRNLISIDEMFEYVGISNEEIPEYIEMANKFADLIGTESEREYLNKYLKKAIPFKYEEPKVYNVQLFFSSDQNFAEINSINVGLEEPSHKISFELSKVGKISFFRFDPMETKGLVIIKEVALKDIKGEFVNINEHYTNADWKIGNNYLFLEDDPQIIFEAEFKQYKSIEITIDYVQNFPEEFMFLVKQEYRLLKEESLQKLLQNKIEKENLINSLNNLSKEKISLESDLNKREEEINILNQDLELSGQEISRLCNEVELLGDKNNELNALLEGREKIISEIFNTKWWKIRLFLVKIYMKISSRLHLNK